MRLTAIPSGELAQTLVSATSKHGLDREDTFSPTNSSKDHLNAEQLPQNNFLNAGEGHQAPRKAAHSLRKEVGQNIKDKKRDKS